MNEEQIIQTLAPLMSEARIARIEEVLAGRLGAITVVLDNLHDEYNLSAIVRSCEGFGVAEVHVIESVQRAKLRRAVTQNCQHWIDLYRYQQSAKCFAHLKSRGFALYGADLTASAVAVGALPVQRLALVFGAEHFGLLPETKAALDGTFQIPMSGFTQSFNVSVAAAIALYATTTKYREHHGLRGDLTEPQKQQARARFYRDSVRGSDLILARTT